MGNNYCRMPLTGGDDKSFMFDPFLPPPTNIKVSKKVRVGDARLAHQYHRSHRWKWQVFTARGTTTSPLKH